MAERTWKVPLPGPEKSLLRYRGKASAELAPLTCYADLKVYSARPDGPHSAAAAGAPDRRGFFLLRRGRPLRLRAARGAEAEAHAPRAGQRPHCRECLASFEPHHCHGTGQYVGAPAPLLQHRGPDAQDHPSGLSQRERLRLPLPAALHRHDGLSCQQGTKSEAEGSERGPCPCKGRAKGQGQGRAKAPHRLVQAAIKQGDYSHLCLRVLCKSGEKCLQMSWGPLRFVDSMNVFPTSLASTIDDLRAR